LFFWLAKITTQKQKTKNKNTLAKNPDDEKGCHHHNRVVTSKEKLTCYYIKERNPSIIIRQKMDRQIRIAARLTKERVQVKAVFKLISSHRRRSMMGHSFQ
jgi:hypothetical protein